MKKIFNQTISTLSDLADFRTKKHRVTLSNVANIDTPGFRPSEIIFSKALQSAENVRIAQTDPGHLKGKKDGQGALSYDIRQSNEQVKLDAEMAGLSENQLLYNATIEILARKFRGIQATLREAK